MARSQQGQQRPPQPRSMLANVTTAFVLLAVGFVVGAMLMFLASTSTTSDVLGGGGDGAAGAGLHEAGVYRGKVGAPAAATEPDAAHLRGSDSGAAPSSHEGEPALPHAGAGSGQHGGNSDAGSGSSASGANVHSGTGSAAGSATGSATGSGTGSAAGSGTDSSSGSDSSTGNDAASPGAGSESSAGESSGSSDSSTSAAGAGSSSSGSGNGSGNGSGSGSGGGSGGSGGSSSSSGSGTGGSGSGTGGSGSGSDGGGGDASGTGSVSGGPDPLAGIPLQAQYDACPLPHFAVDASSTALTTPAAAAAHVTRVKRYAHDGDACSGPHTLYPRDAYLAAQTSADALVPLFAPNTCAYCAAQLHGAPHRFRMFSRGQARQLIDETGSILVIGDSLGRRLMYQLVEMLSSPPVPWKDDKAADRTRTVALGGGTHSTVTFEWSPQLAGIVKHLTRNPHQVRKAKVLLLSLGIHDVWDERKKGFHVDNRVKLLRGPMMDQLVQLLPKDLQVVLLLAPLPGPLARMKGAGKSATWQIVEESRAAARRVGLPTIDAYTFMQANPTAAVEDKVRVPCAEAEKQKFHYVKPEPRQMLGQVFLNMLQWLGPRGDQALLDHEASAAGSGASGA